MLSYNSRVWPIGNRNFIKDGCRYRTFPFDYNKISNKGTTEEKVFLDYQTMDYYREKYSQWLYIENLRDELRVWRPCEYYHQKYIAIASSYAILNYSLFLTLVTHELPNAEMKIVLLLLRIRATEAFHCLCILPVFAIYDMTELCTNMQQKNIAETRTRTDKIHSKLKSVSILIIILHVYFRMPFYFC